MSLRTTSLYAVTLLTAMALIPGGASAISLLGYYEFEGNYNDSTTNGNDAAPAQNPGEVSIVAGGFRGQGADINDPAASGGGNSGGSIDLPINANPPPDISFGGWVNLETNAGFPGFMATDNGGWDRGIHLFGNSWGIASGGTTNGVAPAPTGTWRYVVGTFSKPTNTATLYVGDDSAAVQTTLSGSRPDGAANFGGLVNIEVGRYDNQDLDARVDDIFVFDGALNAHQANAIRNLRLSALDFSPAHAAELFDLFDTSSSGTVNTVAWWPTSGLATSNPGEVFDYGNGTWALLLDNAGNGLAGLQSADAVDDTGTTDEDTVLTSVDPGATSSLLANDLGGSMVTDFSPLSTLGAAVNVNPDGTFSYNPLGAAAFQALQPGQTVVDTFTYTTDGRGYGLHGYAYNVSGMNGDTTLGNIGDGTGSGGLLGLSPISHILIKGDDRIDYRSDGDFRNGNSGLNSRGFSASLDGLPGLNQNDNYATMFTGFLNIPDLLGGGAPYPVEFGTNRSDDPVQIYVDLDGNGLFDHGMGPNFDPGGVSGPFGEMILNRDCCGNGFVTITVAPGAYRFAAVHLERGGGSQIEPTIDLTPDPHGRRTLRPGSTDPADRPGLFSVDDASCATVSVTVTGVDDPLTANDDLVYWTDEDTPFTTLTHDRLMNVQVVNTIGPDPGNNTANWLAVWQALDGGAGPTGTVAGFNIQHNTSDTETLFDYAGGGGNFQLNRAIDSISGDGPGGAGGPFASAGGSGSNYSIRARTFICFPAGGTYTIGMGSDDGRRIQLREAAPGLAPGYTGFTSRHGQVNGGFTPGDTVVGFSGGTGHQWSLGVFSVAAGDILALDSFYYEGGGGDSGELALAKGPRTGFGTGFDLLHDGLHGIRLASTAEQITPGSTGLLTNDTDTDNGILVSAVDTTGTLGSVSVNPNGTFTYDPNGQFEHLNVGDMAMDTFDYTATTATLTRFVKLKRNGPPNALFHIGEIEVFEFGVAPAPNFDGANDLALTSKGASVESVIGFGGHGIPEATIDGAEQTGGATWTKQHYGGAEIIIDLGAGFSVGRVRAHQRNDGCCPERLEDFTVTLLADDGTGNPGPVVSESNYPGQAPANGFAELAFPAFPPVSQTATAKVTVHGVNDPPTVTGSGVPDQCIFTSSPSGTVNLFDYFEDVDNDDDELTYAVTGNDNPALVQTSPVSSVDGILTLSTPCTLKGVAILTVTVTDPGGLSVSDTFVVEVKDDVPPVFAGAKDKVYSVPAGGTADASAHFAGISATDKVDGPVAHTCTLAGGGPLPAGNLFPVGVHPIECTAQDSASPPNVTTVSFNIIVLEIQPSPGLRLFDLVTLRGDTVSGAGIPGGATLSNVQRAFLNNNNEIIYAATLANAGTSNAAVFAGTLAAQTAIATKNTPSGVGDYGVFSNLSLNDGNIAAFESKIEGNQGHFLDSGGGPVVTARKNLVAPLGGGEVFGTLQKPALASNGELLTRASLALGSGPGVTIADDSLILTSSGTVLAREGEPTSIALTTYDQLHSRIVASEDNDHYAFSSFLLEDAGFDPDDNTGLFTGTLGGGLPALVARENDPAPGIAGATLFQFLGEAVNSSGDLAFRCNLAGTGVNSTNNEALYTNSGGALVLVAREGEVAPCLPDNLAAFGRFDTFYMADDGSVCFRAFLQNATATPVIHSGNDGSVWRWKDGVLHLVAREGDMANNTDGAVIRTIDGFSCSGAGGITYWTSFVPGLGDSVTSNNLAVFLDRGAADAAPELILRRRDLLDLGGGEFRRVVGIKLSTEENNGGGTGGYGRTINDAGNILLNLTLSRNQSGLFVLAP